MELQPANEPSKNFPTSRRMRLQSTKSSKIRLHFLMATTCLIENKHQIQVSKQPNTVPKWHQEEPLRTVPSIVKYG